MIHCEFSYFFSEGPHCFIEVLTLELVAADVFHATACLIKF